MYYVLKVTTLILCFKCLRNIFLENCDFDSHFIKNCKNLNNKVTSKVMYLKLTQSMHHTLPNMGLKQENQQPTEIGVIGI